MPIFEYACNGCGREFETLVRQSAPAPACPSCHGTELTKKLSTFAAITSSAAPSFSDAPAGCGSCGHPGGPGACQFD
jgi:putative FmdB family regulatory protein